LFVFFLKPLVGTCVHGANCASFVLAVTHVDALIRRLISQVIYVAMKLDCFDEFKCGRIIDIELPFAAGGKKFLRLGSEDHALGVRNSGDAMDTRPSANLDYFHGIIAWRCHQQLVLPVKSKMTESPVNTVQRNGFRQDQRPRRFRRKLLLRERLNAEYSNQAHSRKHPQAILKLLPCWVVANGPKL